MLGYPWIGRRLAHGSAGEIAIPLSPAGASPGRAFA